MDFADGFAVAGGGMAVAGDAAEGLFADDFGAGFNLAVEDELVGAVDLVIGEDAVVEDEPAGAPPTPIVDPLVQDAGDSVADDVFQHHLLARRRRRVLAGEPGGGGALNRHSALRRGGAVGGAAAAAREGPERGGGHLVHR